VWKIGFTTLMDTEYLDPTVKVNGGEEFSRIKLF
jgi:hypothetical protein